MSSSSSSVLSEPVHYKITGKTAPNRFLKSAMTERLCVFEDGDENLGKRGKPTPEYLKLYEEWGKGEIGTIILGNIPIHREGLEAKKNLIIDRDSEWDAVAEIKQVVDLCKAHGSLCIGQLTHGGRQTSLDIVKTPVSSSDQQNPDAMGMSFGKPRPLTVEEIDDLVDRWAYGAKVLEDAGADGAQLHAAHGYLLSQFLSARVNKRTDDYGGSLENRSRVVFRIIKEIQKRVKKDFIIAIKMNSADFADGGFTKEESAEIAVKLEEAGVDLIELSGGTYESGAFEHKKESTKKRESYFIEFAADIRPTLKQTTLAVTGGFRSKKAMEQAISEKSTDIIGLARPLTAEPFFCRDILSGKIQEAHPNEVPSALQTPASIAQLGAIGSGKDIPDLANKETAQHLVDVFTGKKPKEEQPHSEQNTTASYEKN